MKDTMDLKFADVKDQTREYIRDAFLLGTGYMDVPDNGSLLELGIIDSTGVLELMQFLCDKFGIQIEDEEILPENLDSLENIGRFVVSKKSDLSC